MKVTQSCLTLCNPMDCIVCGILQIRILEWVAFHFSRGSSQPRDQTHLPHYRQILLPVEPQGKPKNTGVGSLSLLQWIFLTQELNHGLLHCRQILQLGYQGSPQPQSSTERDAVTTCGLPSGSVSGIRLRCRGTLLTPFQLLQCF